MTVAERKLLRESCREETPSGEKCGAPAEFILWGKLIPPEGLGPRCYDHAAEHVGHRALGDPAWAIFDLRTVSKLLDRLDWLEEDAELRRAINRLNEKTE